MLAPWLINVGFMLEQDWQRSASPCCRSNKWRYLIEAFIPRFQFLFQYDRGFGTSQDTGSPAIYGSRGQKDVPAFILHPKGRERSFPHLYISTGTSTAIQIMS